MSCKKRVDLWTLDFFLPRSIVRVNGARLAEAVCCLIQVNIGREEIGKLSRFGDSQKLYILIFLRTTEIYFPKKNHLSSFEFLTWGFFTICNRLWDSSVESYWILPQEEP